MLANVHVLPPRCPERTRPMQLVLANAHVYPPVRSFESSECETDAICQWQPLPIDHRHTRQLRG